MVVRPHGVTPTQPPYPRCTNAEQCHQAHDDLDDSREMLEAAGRTIDGRDRAIEVITAEAGRRIEAARAILAGRGPRCVEDALAILAGSAVAGRRA